MANPDQREIRFNYTSADDRQVVLFLLGPEGWEALSRLRERRVTGRLARLLMRVLGEEGVAPVDEDLAEHPHQQPRQASRHAPLAQARERLP
ncbi:MAG TPA: DUF3683 domain-containing protein, partial [Candidatus Methanoperedens sp.]|nr:DUF3683 domain-containing protein [Candidatus Methanoperedens sp.]